MKFSIFVILMLCAAEGFAGGVVKLKNYAEVKTRFVRLHQVAEFDTRDGALLERLNRVMIGAIGENEESMVVEREEVIRRLRQYGIRPDQAMVIGASYVCVRKFEENGKPRLVGADEQTYRPREEDARPPQLRPVEDAKVLSRTALANECVGRITEEYARRFAGREQRFELIEDAEFGKLIGKVTQVGALVELSTEDENLRARIRVALSSGKEGMARIRVAFRKRRTVAAAATPIRKGQAITAAMLKIREAKDGEETPAPEALIGKTADRAIDRDEIVSVAKLKKEIVVKAGDIVKVVFKNGLYQLENEGMEALADGAEGERIRVAEPLKKGARHNAPRENVIVARVVTRGIVEVAQ